jgi:hypothetical protein
MSPELSARLPYSARMHCPKVESTLQYLDILSNLFIKFPMPPLESLVESVLLLDRVLRISGTVRKEKFEEECFYPLSLTLTLTYNRINVLKRTSLVCQQPVSLTFLILVCSM